MTATTTPKSHSNASDVGYLMVQLLRDDRYREKFTVTQLIEDPMGLYALEAKDLTRIPIPQAAEAFKLFAEATPKERAAIFDTHLSHIEKHSNRIDSWRIPYFELSPTDGGREQGPDRDPVRAEEMRRNRGSLGIEEKTSTTTGVSDERDRWLWHDGHPSADDRINVPRTLNRNMSNEYFPSALEAGAHMVKLLRLDQFADFSTARHPNFGATDHPIRDPNDVYAVEAKRHAKWSPESCEALRLFAEATPKQRLVIFDRFGLYTNAELNEVDEAVQNVHREQREDNLLAKATEQPKQAEAVTKEAPATKAMEAPKKATAVSKQARGMSM